MHKPTIGFIGQGWIGKNYADDFERRGFTVIRYSMEERYVQNKDKIKEADIVFVAVPTPTTPEGFDDSIVRNVMALVGIGKTVVIKSTILPGTTESIQKEYPDIFVLHSPEFLTELTARHDVEHPERNIIGIPHDTPEYRAKAEAVMAILPRAYFQSIIPVRDAEFFKYVRNCFFFVKVVYMNMLYDLGEKFGCNWANITSPLAVDPWVGPMHNNPIHKGGRGAGGHCLIKDFATFAEAYRKLLPDDENGGNILKGMEEKNIDLLKSTKKDLELLKGVYGDRIK